MTREFDIPEELKKLPSKPGVYIMHDAEDTIIYVGKAISLKNRVRQYFQDSRNKGPKIEKMVTHIAWFEYIVTASELEALVLECNLIKEHRPHYNTMLTDDKTYPFIKVTTGEDYPRVLFSRQMKKDKSRYFGPYTSAAAVKESIDLIRKLYSIRTCNRRLPADQGRERPCLYYHMGQCKAPCQGYVTKEAYALQIKGALDFLNGDYRTTIKEYKAKMEAASMELRFEEAAGYRDLIRDIEKVGERQKITASRGEERDVLALAVDGSDAVIQVFFVRDGKMIGREHHYMQIQQGDQPEEILGSFVKQYYAGTPYVPREILLPYPVEDMEIIARWLSDKQEQRVNLRVPVIGQKEKLVEMARENARMILEKDRERIRREEGRTVGAVRQIEKLIGLSGIRRMEAFDISHISGYESVGSMVVYEKGRPRKNDYRKFRLKWIEGNDDYAAMREVLTRRFEHGLKQAEKGSEGFDVFPDLILMDGGKGQVNIALEVLESLGLSIPVCGMVKDEHHRTRGLYYNNEEIPIDRHSEGFLLITRIQDEAHRFAITYHRLLRSKGQVRSILDDIPGIGPTRRKGLLRTFGSAEGIAGATVEELAAAEGMNRKAAQAVYHYFQKRKAPLS